MSEKEKEWGDKLTALENRMKGESIIPPKSDEDIEEWAKEYPDVAGIVETIAAKKAQEMYKKAESRLAELDEIQYEATRKSAEATIRETHPDFDTLRKADEFHDWAEAQPKWVQDAIYENADDPASVVRVIDLYKVDKGLTKTAKKASKKAAASLVSKNSKASVDVDESSAQIRESEVAKMSAKEFEKRQKRIEKAKKIGDSDEDLQKLTKEMEEELEPKQKALMELHSQLMGKIRYDINKAIQDVAKSYGIDVVLNKEIVIQGPMGPVGKEEVVLYGGFNMTNFVIETLNK